MSNLRTPICDMFDIEVPIFLAGMGGVAYADVCAAVSAAGAYGTLGMATENPEGIRKQMRRVREITDKPFGVDLLAALPDTVMAAIDVVIGEGASSFIAGLGVPETVIERCHDAGLKVVSMCGKVSHAVRAEQAGCDVVVAQGTEAGGHTGQVAGIALIPQIVDAVDIPVLAAGSIVDGRGLAASLAFGAQGVWMGTRFIASHEAHAAEIYKKSITEIGSADTIVTRCYSGKPMRVVRNAYVDDWESRPGDIQPFPQQIIVSQSNDVMPLLRGDTSGVGIDRDTVCMPVGQGAGGILDILPCAEIIARVMNEARETIDRLSKLT
ncbi:MAG: nitronate monooxygenase [Deltaproteobacteria bacterium]|nr:nitronate monooxygenase [Myxococcales bacterium]TDJ11158.1 MAG: nitronate monooxygenase [Deltaproteobacteria bacterium]TDJ16085.1 MAG: nitronate monooxygenase [Deltaproteobacteria bacterium]